MIQKLTFEVSETPIIYDVNGISLKSDKHKVVYRTDNKSPLSVMKNSYQLLLNEHFMESVDRMKDASGFELIGYSELKGGSVVLAHLKNNQENLKINGMPIEDYLLMGNSHDFTFPFFIGTTTEFIRCKNQFSRISRGEKIRHTKSQPKSIESLLSSLELYFLERKKLAKTFEVFAKICLESKNYLKTNGK